MALVLADDLGELLRSSVVRLARRGAVGSERAGGDADVELGVLGGGAGSVLDPLVVVEGGVAVDGQRAGHGVVVVVVELGPEVVELGVLDQHAHVGLRDRALRSASDVVLVLRVRLEARAQRCDHRRVVLVAPVHLQVEVESVNEGISQRSLRLRVTGLAVRLPEVFADLSRLVLRLQRVGAGSAADGQDNLLAVALAGRDGLGQGFTVLALAGVGDEARLADGAGRDIVSVTELVQER